MKDRLVLHREKDEREETKKTHRNEQIALLQRKGLLGYNGVADLSQPAFA